MTVLAYSEDPVAAAKVVEEYAKGNPKLDILGGAMGETLWTRRCQSRAEMPSREELIASIAGCIGAPASNIAGAIGAPASNIASILSTIEEKAALSNVISAWVETRRWNTLIKRKESKMADLKKLAEDIVGLTLLEAQELKTILKDEYGIEPAAGGAVMMAGPAAMLAAQLKRRQNSTSF